MSFRQNLNFGKIFTALAMLVLFQAAASPGILKVTCDPGTEVKYKFDNNGDGKIDDKDDTTSKFDENNDGKVEFGLGSLDEEKKIGIVRVIKISDGGTVDGEGKLNENGNTLASLEPFEFPSFSASIVLVTVLDAVAFLQTTNPFTVDQLLNVMNGTIAESSAVIFKDGSSIPDLANFSSDLIASLPNYTGEAKVTSFDSVEPVPEPATWLGITLAAAAATGNAARRKYPRVQSIRSH